MYAWTRVKDGWGSNEIITFSGLFSLYEVELLLQYFTNIFEHHTAKGYYLYAIDKFFCFHSVSVYFYDVLILI